MKHGIIDHFELLQLTCGILEASSLEIPPIDVNVEDSLTQIPGDTLNE